MSTSTQATPSMSFKETQEEKYPPVDIQAEVESAMLRAQLKKAAEVWRNDTLTIRRLRADLLRIEGELVRHRGNALTILHNLSPQDGGLRRDEVCDDVLGKALALIPYFSSELDRLREIEGRIAILRGR